MARSPTSDLIGIKKGAWTYEEDQKLCDYIANHGVGAWNKLPQKAGLLRCGKSCRLRWNNYLKPGIKRGEFSPEEEQIIIRLYSSLGSKWSTIAKHLPGRTDNEIKNYWSTRLKRVAAQMGTHQSCASVSTYQKKLIENNTLLGKRAPEFDESSKTSISTTSSKLLNKVASKFALSGSLSSLVTKSISPQFSNKEIFSSSVGGGDNSLMSTTSASDNNVNDELISSSARLLNRMATRISPHLSLASTKAIASKQIPPVFDVGNSSGTCGDQSMNKVDQDEAFFGQISNEDGYNYYSSSMDEMVRELMGSNSLNDDTYYFGDFTDSTQL